MKKIIILTTLTLVSTACLASNVKVTVNAVAHDYLGMVGYESSTSSQHDIEIINDSDEDKTFRYDYSYCANKCVSAGNSITVKAHTKWNNHYNGYVSSIFKSPGNYQLVAKTTVHGEVEKVYTGFGSLWIK